MREKDLGRIRWKKGKHACADDRWRNGQARPQQPVRQKRVERDDCKSNDVNGGKAAELVANKREKIRQKEAERPPLRQAGERGDKPFRQIAAVFAHGLGDEEVIVLV